MYKSCRNNKHEPEINANVTGTKNILSLGQFSTCIFDIMSKEIYGYFPNHTVGAGQ